MTDTSSTLRTRIKKKSAATSKIAAEYHSALHKRSRPQKIPFGPILSSSLRTSRLPNRNPINLLSDATSAHMCFIMKKSDRRGKTFDKHARPRHASTSRKHKKAAENADSYTLSLRANLLRWLHSRPTSALKGYTLKSLTTDATFNTLNCTLTPGTTTGDITITDICASGAEYKCTPPTLVPNN